MPKRRLLLCLLLLAGCSSPEARVVSDSSDRGPAEDPAFPMAKLFDDLIQKRLHSEHQQQFEANCQATPAASVFCFSVLNREKLEARAKEVQKEGLPTRYQGKTYRPRFGAKHQVLNWGDLKGAPVPGLLRGMPKGQAGPMKALKLMALREGECPNNPAVAIAATLEDRLPEKVGYDEIGRLYEKGGTCMKDAPADQEQVLTRAGLMYYANADYTAAKTVLRTSAAISGTFVGRALYWLYRAQLKLGETSEAKDTLASLQEKYPFSFHSLVAQTAAGKDPGELLAKTSGRSSKRTRQDPEVNMLLEQVEILHRFGFDASASTVLDWAVAHSRGRGLEPEVMLYLAELKKEQGDYKSKILILSDVLYQNPSLISRQTLELYFPKVLFPIFEKQSGGMDPYFLLAIARRESAFDPNAVSSANAHGLLQVLPKTGRRLKKRPNLFDPETNIAIGAKYITELLKKTNGQVHLALAGYNAGPGKLKGWTRSYPTDDPILFTDLIPFKETREYVGSVLRNYYWYRRIHQTDQPIPNEKILELAIADKAN